MTDDLIETMIDEAERRGLLVELDERIPDGLDRHYIAMKDPATAKQVAHFGSVQTAIEWLRRRPL